MLASNATSALGVPLTPTLSPEGRGRNPFPTSLRACFPVLWTQVLFPGRVEATSTLSWRSLLILVLVPGVLLYPCLSFHLFEPDEGRYAEIPREMLERDEWLVPCLQGEPYLDKPPLFYWLVMGCYRLLGVHDWSARLVPALAVHGCLLLLYLLGRRLVGERAAFWGALSLGLAPGFLSMGRFLILDGLLALCVTLSLLSGFDALRGPRLRWGWWLTSALACGLGVLTKGPVALLLFWPPLWAYRRLTGAGCRLGATALLAHATLILAIVLPWYVAISLRIPSFATYFFWEHNVLRFVDPFNHLRPVWFYLPIVAFGMLPATLLLVPFVRFLLTEDSAARDRRAPELGFLFLAGGWCLLFFTLAGCKLPTYILPALPPLALALGYFFAGSSWERSRALRPCLGLALLALGIAHYGVVPWYARFHSPMSRPADVARYCGDRSTPVVCYPRACDSVSFYLRRDDLRNFRSKDTPALVQFLVQRPRTVILFTHRHSLESLSEVLPPYLRLTGETPLSGSLRSLTKAEMCYMAVVERRP